MIKIDKGFEKKDMDRTEYGKEIQQYSFIHTKYTIVPQFHCNIKEIF